MSKYLKGKEEYKNKYCPVERKSAITRTPEFEKKKLCTHSLDIGLICDHGCLYCSTPTIAAARTNSIFKKNGTTGQKAHNAQIAYVDLETPERVKADAKKLTSSDTVMLCTKVDPYSPAVQELGLFRDCLKNLLEANSECKVRVLSKNAGIVDVLSDFTDYADRIYFSLSITAPPELQEFIDIVEPNTSTIQERIDGIKRAKELGFNVFGMICPCMPGVLNSESQLQAVLDEIVPLKPEAVWLEPVNGRGPGLKNMVAALSAAGKHDWAKPINDIRNKKKHDVYAAALINTIHSVHQNVCPETIFNILVYNDGMALQDMLEDDSDVIWLKNEPRKLKNQVRVPCHESGADFGVHNTLG